MGRDPLARRDFIGKKNKRIRAWTDLPHLRRWEKVTMDFGI